jgi:superfamily II DNA or RNA helicase
MQITIAHGAVNAKLVDPTREAKLLASEALSYMVDGAQFTSAFSKTGWDGKASFFDFKAGMFPAGFVYLVYKAFLKQGYKVNLVRKPFPAPLGPKSPKVDEFPEDPRYSYQPAVVDKLLSHGKIIAQVATGGGKSRIAKLAYRRIGRPTLFLTTRSSLMYQMKASVEEMGERVSVIGDGHPWPEKFTPFTVAMVQSVAPAVMPRDALTEIDRYLKNTIAAEDRKVAAFQKDLTKAKTDPLKIPDLITAFRTRLESARKPDREVAAKIERDVATHNAHRVKMIEFLRSREFVILEEAHEASAEGYYEAMNQCVNAHYRLALTATPFMKDSTEANMRLMAVSGPVAITITEKELIELGILARPYFKYVDLKKTPSMLVDGKAHRLFPSTPWPKCHEIGVTKNVERNTVIVQEALRAVSYGMTVMILVTTVEHGKLLQAMLTQAGLVANYIHGAHEQEERQAALNALKDGRLQVLIGSTILDVGVDVPSVGMICLAGGGKAEVALRQRIGRGLRAKKSGPNVAFIIDFTDSLNSTLRGHGRQRRQIVEATPGFVEGIVPEFEYERLGFAAIAA